MDVILFVSYIHMYSVYMAPLLNWRAFTHSVIWAGTIETPKMC